MKQTDPSRWVRALANSSGHRKIVNYILSIIDTKDFQDFVTRVRTKYDIPKDGFVDEQFTVPPHDWAHQNDQRYEELIAEIREFAQKYHLRFLDGEEVFIFYIFYNEKIFAISVNSLNLCIVSDVSHERLEKRDPFVEKIRDENDRLYPIAVRISPYASLRNILDYIRSNYSREILLLQNKYREKGVKIGKFKQRKDVIRERNNYIYENRNLPRKEILKLIYRKYGFKADIDIGYIGKIISLEKMRRKEM